MNINLVGAEVSRFSRAICTGHGDAASGAGQLLCTGKEPMGTVSRLLAGWWRLSAGPSVLTHLLCGLHPCPPRSHSLLLLPAQTQLKCFFCSSLFLLVTSFKLKLGHRTFVFQLGLQGSNLRYPCAKLSKSMCGNILSESCITAIKLLTENISEESTPSPLGTDQN